MLNRVGGVTMRNEKGSTLIQVLLVILIFSVLGVSLLGNVVGGSKRVDKTDDNVQERNLARDGLTYFEADFKKYIEDHAPNSINLYEDFLLPYLAGKKVPIKDGSISKDLMITAYIENPNVITMTENEKSKKLDSFEIKVEIEEVEGSLQKFKPLVGYYTIDIDVDLHTPTFELANFEGGKELDVSQALLKLNVLDLQKLKALNLHLLDNLLNLDQTLTLNLLSIPGENEDYYPIPDDKLVGGVLNTGGLNLLGTINVLEGNSFDYLKEEKVIAVRKGSVLKANVNLGVLQDLGLDLDPKVYLNLLEHNEADEDNYTNILLNGSFNELNIDANKLNGLLTNVLKLDLQNLLGSSLKSLGIVGDLLEGITDFLGNLLGGATKSLGDVLGSVTTVISNLTNELLDILNGKINNRENYFSDIDFGKLAVTGNALIKQDAKDSGNADGRRGFSFANGLFVNKSLYISGFAEDAAKEKYSMLELEGDMAVTEELIINNADLKLVDSNIYVNDVNRVDGNGNATIKNSCINSNDNNRNFRLYVQKKLTLENNTEVKECRSLNGLFYAEDIVINTNGKDMTINGAVMGNVKVNGSGKVTINVDREYLKTIKINNAALKPQGRAFAENE